MQLIFYIFMFNSLFAFPESRKEMVKDSLNEYCKERADFTSDENFEQFNLLENDCLYENNVLLETQRALEREEINQVLNNADEKLRLRFTSDENFKQFELLKRDDSRENIGLTRKFVNAAIDSNTITKEEVEIFRDYIDRIENFRAIKSQREKYFLEEWFDESHLKMEKITESTHEVCQSLDQLNENLKKEEKQIKESIAYRIGSWVCSLVDDKNKESIAPETKLQNRKPIEEMAVFHKDMDEKEKKK